MNTDEKDTDRYKFIGLKALGCAMIGILLSIILESTYLNKISTVSGLILTTSMVLIVIGVGNIAQTFMWPIVISVTIFHILLAWLFYPYSNFQPIMLAPLMFIEVAGFLILSERLRRGSSER